MEDWLAFEVQCTQYLNEKFGHLAAFCHLGGENSTVSDIKAVANSGRTFYIDAKLTPSQCGQFVLLPDVSKGCFVFSAKNKTPLTPQVQAIMDWMNTDFEAYKEAGTAGKEIDLGDGGKIFRQWIISAYKQKGTEFFITNGYTILPIEDFSAHFDVFATYRVKRSGSAAVGISRTPKVMQYLQQEAYPIKTYAAEGGKLYVSSSASLHGRRFVSGGNEYMFSARGDNYEIRRLSNTFNANVIFTIVKKQAQGLTDGEFSNLLR